MLMGDVFIEIMRRGMVKHTRVARINYHLSFLDEDQGMFKVCFDGKAISKGN